MRGTEIRQGDFLEGMLVCVVVVRWRVCRLRWRRDAVVVMLGAKGNCRRTYQRRPPDKLFVGLNMLNIFSVGVMFDGVVVGSRDALISNFLVEVSLPSLVISMRSFSVGGFDELSATTIYAIMI